MVKIRKKLSNKSKKPLSLKGASFHKNYIKHIAKFLITVLFGFIFTLIFFEISLFVSGKLGKILQKTQNNFSKTDEFVILALGESTTTPMFNLKMQDYSWPSYLENLLNEEDLGKKIKVINEGKEGINSYKILRDLEKNIDKYDPDLVISIMGINDFFEEIAYETAAGIVTDSLLSKSRTYKLIKFLISNIKEKNELKTKEILDCDSEQSCIDLVIQQKSDNYSETKLAIKFLEKALKYNSDNALTLTDLGYRYMFVYTEDTYRREQEEKTIKQAIEYFKKAIEKDPTNPIANAGLIKSLEISVDSTSEIILVNTKWVKENIKKYKIKNADLFLALANCPKCHKEEITVFSKDKNRIFYLNKALETDPQNPYVLFELARYYTQNENFEEAIKFYLRVLEADMRNQIHTSSLIELATAYLETNQKELANEILKQAMDVGGMYAKNYQQLYKILKSKDIKLIAAQYPMRSSESLELIFKDKNDVLLVDNELIFKNAVKEKGYDQIFVDRFAGDFGHCSEEGNLLLAKNISSVILDNWKEISGEN